MGTWLDEDAVRELRETASPRCVIEEGHEQISDTMPFCRHCGGPMPLPSAETPVEQLVSTLVGQMNTDEPPQGLSLAELKQALEEVDDDYPTKLAYEKVVSAARRVVAESEQWLEYLHATFATATQGDSTS